MLSGNLYEYIISSKNIYNAIYSLDSYIFEKGLLDDNDMNLYMHLKDKYNFKLIDAIIKKCKEKLIYILNSDELFDIKVYFKMKKFNERKKEIEYRPIHTADLITQICIIALLNVIAFNDTGKYRQLSDVSKLIPSNFYGNIPSIEVESIFYDWHKKYKEYSKSVIDEYNLCQKTQEYKYEVCLDLENFFPSIDPDVIYNILINKMKVTFKNEDHDCLKKLLKKLLFFNICNISKCYKSYYRDRNFNNSNNNKYPSLGIPQGLPQSYYFGNICMMEIAKIIEEKFSGKAYYYVDDSVIYTNSDNASNEKFKSTIKYLNKKINSVLKSYIKDSKCSQNKFDDYEIKIHEDEKSIVSDIQNEKKYGRNFLKQINLGVSSITYDLVNALDELQDETIHEKTKLFYNAIQKEIELIKNKINNLHKSTSDSDNSSESVEAYLKLLKRYKKFFLYRIKIIKYSREDLKEDDLKKYYEKYKIENTNKFTINDKKHIFEIFDEDIFAAEASLFLKFADTNEKRSEIYNKISKYEDKLTDCIPKNNLYYTKCLSSNLNSLVVFDEYKTLKLLNCKYINKNKKYSYDEIIKNILIIIGEVSLDSKDKNDLDNVFLGYNLKNYTKFIIDNSNTFKIRILNCLLSQLFGVNVNNEFNLFKINNRVLQYFELRILIYIRNNHCEFKKALVHIEEILKEVQNHNIHDKIDYSILEVLNIFVKYVKNPDYIDNLILTHKYIMSVWKNGSKNLYFYTLHNQEHSVELIREIVSICKSIDFLKIKPIDYYVLFLSCYLHDISMILQPDYNLFIADEEEADIIYVQWIDKFKKIIEEDEDNIFNKSLIKKFILDFYISMDIFFENKVRSNHAKDSGNFIKSTEDLDYIESTVRNVVANVSKAHGFYTQDVYGIKSTGQNEVINEKFLMILLRLADLMDMTKDRVSLNIMRLNAQKMSKVSQFHWISHAAIDSCNIQSKYNYTKDENSEDDNITFLDKSYFNERIEVNLNLNTKNLTAMESKKCRNIDCILLRDDELNLKMLNRIGENAVSCKAECNFMCQWMCKKNEYLINELNALNIYLSRNKENNFNTEIYLNIHMKDTNSIPQQYIQTVLEYISED